LQKIKEKNVPTAMLNVINCTLTDSD